MSKTQSYLDIYELAYLAKGASRVANSIVIDLIEREYLYWDKERKKLVRLQGNDGALTDLEQQVMNALVNNDKAQIKSICSQKVISIQNFYKLCGITINHFGYYDGLGGYEGFIYLIGQIGMAIFFVYLTTELPLPKSIVNNFFLTFPIAMLYVGIFVISSFCVCMGIAVFVNNIASGSRLRDRLLKEHRQKTSVHPPFSNSSLSKAYALYGSVILTDSKFKGLAEFLNPMLVKYPERKNPDSSKYDSDYDPSEYD